MVKRPGRKPHPKQITKPKKEFPEELVDRMVQLYSEGLSTHRISRMLDTCSDVQVAQKLRQRGITLRKRIDYQGPSIPVSCY